MNDKLMDALANWRGNVSFSGKYESEKENLEAELTQRKKLISERKEQK
jgi:hypothetical protein